MISRMFVVAAAFCFAVWPAAAQQNFYVRPYFSFNNGMEPIRDLIIKERRNGRELSAVTADFCIPVGNKLERIVMDLKQDSEKLEGSAVSQGSGTRVSLRLIRTTKGDQIVYAGTIYSGLKEYAVSSDGAYAVEESVHLQESPPGPELFDTPEHFLKASPQALSVRIKHGTLAEWIKLLRGNNFTLDLQAAEYESRACNELRVGYQAFRVSFPPEQLQAAMKKLKAMPMVIAVGYSSTDYYRSTVRVARKPWLSGNNLDRNRIAAQLGRAVAKALNATLLGSEWQATTGELILRLKRPSVKFPGLGLTEMIPVRVLLSAERPNGSEYFLIWLGDTMGQLVDDNSGPRVNLSQIYFFAAPPEGIPLELEDVATAIATAFNGKKWNPELEVWE